MAKRNADNALSTPAVWERLLGALLWALQGLIWFGLITALPALVAGFVTFLLTRKRRPFLTRVTGRFLIWWLVLNLSQPLIVLIGLQKGMAGKTMEVLLKNNLPTLVNSPGLIPQYWQVYDPQAKAIMTFLLGALALNVLVSLGGIVFSLLGSQPRQPQAESAPLPEAV